jgi:hypothetical protein
MLKSILNIALGLSLIISITGVTTSKFYCTALKGEIAKSCCQDQQQDNDCCKQEIEYKRLSSDLTTVNASVEMPDILLFAVAYLSTLDQFADVLNKQHSYINYSPPLLTSDIPVINQVFRI